MKTNFVINIGSALTSLARTNPYLNMEIGSLKKKCSITTDCDHHRHQNILLDYVIEPKHFNQLSLMNKYQ